MPSEGSGTGFHNRRRWPGSNVYQSQRTFHVDGPLLQTRTDNVSRHPFLLRDFASPDGVRERGRGRRSRGLPDRFQYTNVPAASSIGAFTSASTYGGAILANYSFGADTPLAGFSLPIRFEYIASTGSVAKGSPNLLYGPGSNAWSITLTPTSQYKIFFARVEFSHVGTSSTTPGLVFGRDGMNTTQTRGVLEAGILF